MDLELPKRYHEPSWNFQMIHLLVAEGKDSIPRQDHAWTTPGVAQRMTPALAAAKRPVPDYLEDLAASQ